jgi:hypothetical protein
MSSKQVGVGQTVVLVLTLVLIMVGLGLSTAGLLNPSWQVVDIREFRAEHHVRFQHHIISILPSSVPNRQHFPLLIGR